MSDHPIGLGLAVVARVVEQLGGQLRVDSKIGEGSRFSCLLPFPIASSLNAPGKRSVSTDDTGTGGSGASNTSEIDSLVEALSSSHMAPIKLMGRGPTRRPKARKVRAPAGGEFQVEDSAYPLRGIKVDEFDIDSNQSVLAQSHTAGRVQHPEPHSLRSSTENSLRILIVEVRSLVKQGSTLNRSFRMIF